MNNGIKSIQVLGSGCPTCKQLFETTKKIAAELKTDLEVEYITDITKMIEMGIMSSPALVVDGKIVLTGAGHQENSIKEALTELSEKESGCTSCSGCSGGCSS